MFEINVSQAALPAYPALPPTKSIPVLPNRPLFLVSVQNETEASFVIDQRIDILDFKAPQRGPLSPVAKPIWSWAAHHVHSIPLSAALGEIDEAEACVNQLPSEFRFAKVGLSNVRSESRVLHAWEHFQKRLPLQTQLVAVAYADHHAAKSLTAERIFDLAREFGLRWLLIDTFRKGTASSIQVLGWHRLRSLHTQAISNQQHLTIAGSIRRIDLKGFQDRQLRVHAFGARGDLCPGPRHHRLDRVQVKRWVESLESF